MTIQQLIEILESAEDKSLDVVIRTDNSHGANIVSRTSYWSAIEATASHHTCDVLLPDSDTGEYQVFILS